MVPCPYSDIIFLTRQSICWLSEKSNLSSPCSVLPLSRQWGMSWERYGSERHAPCSETVAIRCDEWTGACCHGKWRGWRNGCLAFLENFLKKMYFSQRPLQDAMFRDKQAKVANRCVRVSGYSLDRLRYGGRGWSKIKSRKTCIKEWEGRRGRGRATRRDWSGSQGRASSQSASQEQKDRVIVLM